MRIVSYRGPNAPGGVSNALTQVFDRNNAPGDWWSISDSGLERRNRSQQVDNYAIDESTKVGHYRY